MAQSFPKGRLSGHLQWLELAPFRGDRGISPGDVREGTGVVSRVLTGRLLLPGGVGGERDQQAGYQLVLCWAAVDVTEQVYMEPPPRCQLPQSSFSHYLILSLRKSAKGRGGILLPAARGWT